MVSRDEEDDLELLQLSAEKVQKVVFVLSSVANVAEESEMRGRLEEGVCVGKASFEVQVGYDLDWDGGHCGRGRGGSMKSSCGSLKW